MKYRHTITVPYQDVDASRRLRLYAMENYLLNIAGKVADEMGIGIPSLLPMNYTWIITHMNMEMMFLPKHGDVMVVETWIERNAHMLSVRDFRIYQPQADGTEILIGCAKSVWAVLDLTSREIVNIFDHEMFANAVDGEVQYGTSSSFPTYPAGQFGRRYRCPQSRRSAPRDTVLRCGL